MAMHILATANELLEILEEEDEKGYEAVALLLYLVDSGHLKGGQLAHCSGTLAKFLNQIGFLKPVKYVATRVQDPKPPMAPRELPLAYVLFFDNAPNDALAANYFPLVADLNVWHHERLAVTIPYEGH